MKIRDKILAIVYFILNAFVLTPPLLYSNFISLIFIKKLLKTKYFIITISFVFTLLIYLIIHLYYGVELDSYLQSLAIYLLVFVNIIVAHNYIKNLGGKIHLLFEYIVKINFIFFLVGLFLLLTDYSDIVWRYYSYGESSSTGMPRFKGFLYEPSYYALIFSPLLLYFFYRFILIDQSFKSLKYLIFISIPVVSTWSFGVLLGMFIAISTTAIYYSIKYFKINKYILITFSLIPVGVFFLFLFDTQISDRIIMNFEGKDLSTKGRISDSFIIANHLINEKNPFFGIGLGQIKVLGEEYIQNYYGYPKWFRVSIPNAFAETLAIFGYIGAFLRLFVQLFLFFYKKCYNNIFSLALFTFIFVYQFTGSFITSTIEYIIWLMALMNIFPEFNIIKKHAKNSK